MSFLKSLLAVILTPIFAFSQVQTGGTITMGGQVTVATSNAPAPTFAFTAPAGEPSGVVGTSYTGNSCSTINGTGTITYSTSISISGLSFNTSTCVFSGTPTVAGNYSPTITATDSSTPTHKTATLPLSIGIAAAPVAGGGHNDNCNSLNQWTGPTSKPVPGGNAAAPTGCVNTALSNSPSPGAVVNVTAGSCTSLQNAITNATAGQTIVLPAKNGTVKDQFAACRISPAAAGNASNWITVTTDQSASLPPEGSRITPAWAGVTSLPSRPSYAQPATAGIYMPQIDTTNNWVIQFQPTAAYWRFIGIEISCTTVNCPSQLIQPNGAGANHIIFDRVWIHGGATNDVQSGMAFNGLQYAALIDSTITDTHCGSTCTQSQGVSLGGNSTSPSGPFKISNNFIESAGENIFNGGSGQAGLTILPSSDVQIIYNHTFKPLIWKANDPSYFGTHFEVDNDMELKNGQRYWIEGNIFDQNWGFQGSQQGNAIIFGPRNQSAPVSGSGTSDGAGTITRTSGGSFDSAMTASTCGAAPGHCLITFGGANFEIATFVDANHVTTQSYQGGPAAPPLTTTNTSFTAYNPGLNPNAVNDDIIFINNYIVHSARVGAVAIVGSNGNDMPLELKRIYIANNSADDINGFLWTIGLGGCCVWSTGEQIQSSAGHFVNGLTLDHNTFIEFLTGGSNGLGPGFGFGQPVQTLNNIQITNNISAGGFGNNATAEALWTAWTPLNQLCFDHNFFAIATNPFGPNGNGNFKTDDNPPYPTAADNQGCSFTATGNTRLADFNAFQFTANNNGVGVNMQLQPTSPAHNAASDGTDVGVNWTQLQNAIANVY